MTTTDLFYCKIEDTQAVEDAIRAACDQFSAPELTTLEVYTSRDLGPWTAYISTVLVMSA